MFQYIREQDSVIDLIPQMPHFYLMVGVGITMFKQVWSLAPGLYIELLIEFLSLTNKIYFYN